MQTGVRGGHSSMREVFQSRSGKFSSSRYFIVVYPPQTSCAKRRKLPPRILSIRDGADARGLTRSDFPGERRPIALEIIDAGDRTIGTNAHVILAADIHGVCKVSDHVRRCATDPP